MEEHRKEGMERDRQRPETPTRKISRPSLFTHVETLDSNSRHGNPRLADLLDDTLGGTVVAAVCPLLNSPLGCEDGTDALEEIGNEEGEHVRVNVGPDQTPFAWGWVRDISDVVSLLHYGKQI